MKYRTPASLLVSYCRLNLGLGIYQLIHWVLNPSMFADITRGIPKDTLNIADLGCGLGMVSFYLERHCPHARIMSVDLQGHRIDVCGQLSEKLSSSVCFQVMDILQDIPVASVYIVNDVMMYFSEEKQLQLVRNMVTKEPDCIYIKTHKIDSGLKFQILQLEEKIGKWLRVMLGTERDSSYFSTVNIALPNDKVIAYLSSNGYRVSQWSSPVISLLPHLVLIARKV